MWKPNTSISSSSFKSLSQLPMSSQNCLAKNNLGSQQSIKEVPEQQQVHVNGAASDSSLSSLSSLSNKQQVKKAGQVTLLLAVFCVALYFSSRVTGQCVLLPLIKSCRFLKIQMRTRTGLVVSKRKKSCLVQSPRRWLKS